MQLKKHNSKTPPERKPKWLRKGIALLAAVATLATGGVVASTAYAGGGGGSQNAGGWVGGGSIPHVFWQYRDGALSDPNDVTSGSFGRATDYQSVKRAFDAAGATISSQNVGGSVGSAKVQAALNAANTECVSGFHRRHPGEGDGDCRVVAVGAMLITGSNEYNGTAFDNTNHAELGGKNQWQAAWDTYIKSNTYHYAGTQPYTVDTAFTDDPNMSVQKIMARDTYNDINKWDDPIVHIRDVNKSIVVIVLDKYQPTPPSFTPTISTEAPHIIQEGQPITDRVTVGVKSGDHWIDGTSVTAKGYYFTGSKDVIIRNLPYNGDPTDAGINNYLNQIRSAGGEYPWVTGMGARYGLNRAESGPWVRDGDKNDSRAGRKRERRPAGRVRPGRRGGPPECHFAPLPIAYCLSPVELGLVCGQDGFVVFFRSVGQEDRRLSHAESRLVQGQQYPGSFASEVFPADKQDRRVRSCGLDHSFTLVEVGYAGVPQQLPQGRNTRLRGSRLRVFDGPQLAEE